ncbi:MAG TPA: hypothetical protein VHA57_04860 [Actinomycetota bacterium]|nr:hypothetical protein [Actinomycetota bacterium]
MHSDQSTDAQDAEELAAGRGGQAEDPLFPGPGGGHLSRDAVRRIDTEPAYYHFQSPMRRFEHDFWAHYRVFCKVGVPMPEWRESGPFGDRYRLDTGSEQDRERLRREFAELAKLKQPRIVAQLEASAELVFNDFGLTLPSELFQVLWVPGYLENQLAPFFGTVPVAASTGTWWLGLVYRDQQFRTTVLVDVSLEHKHWPYTIAFTVQDGIDELLREPRPACPVHGHQLRPQASLAGSVWVCPEVEPAWWCFMGSYAAKAKEITS